MKSQLWPLNNILNLYRISLYFSCRKWGNSHNLLISLWRGLNEIRHAKDLAWCLACDGHSEHHQLLLLFKHKESVTLTSPCLICLFPNLSEIYKFINTIRLLIISFPLFHKIFLRFSRITFLTGQ